MARRAIGIDIGPHHIRGVQMVRDGDQLRVEKVFAAPMRRSTDRPSEVLRDLAHRHGFDWRADTAIALPPASVFYLGLPAQDPVLDQIRQGDVTALADVIPVSPDQMLVRICDHPALESDRSFVLVAATSRAAMEDQTALTGQVQPRLVETEAHALWNAVLANHPQAGTGRVLIAYIEASHLTVVVAHDGHVVFVRSVPWTSASEPDAPGSEDTPLADLIRATFHKAFGYPIDGDTTVFVATGDASLSEPAIQALTQILGVTVIQVDPYAKVSPPEASPGPMEILVAQGLAIRALAPRQTQGVDFLAVDHGRHRSRTSPRRELALCVTLACAIGIVWLIGLWTQRSCLESQVNQVRAQMSDLFHKAMPEEKRMVSPLAQVQKRLDRVTEEYRVLAPLQQADAHPLVVLERLGASRQGLPDVVIRDLLINHDGVRMRGTCPSFDQVYQWQRRLEEVPGFARVQVEEPTRDPKTGQVEFTILIESRLEEDHDRT